MIREKRKLTGNLNVKQSLSGSLSNSVIYVEPITQEKEVTPTKEIQEITPDTGYTGLSKVKVNGYTIKTAEKTIVENGTYDASKENLDGYSKIKVAINNSIFSGSYDRVGLKQIGWTDEEIDYYNQNGVQWNASEDEYFKLTTEELAGDTSTNTRFLPKNNGRTSFQNYYRLLAIATLDNITISTFASLFYGCYSLTAIPNLDTSNSTDMSYAFFACRSLESIPQLNTSKVKDMSQTFRYCSSLVTIPLLDTSSVTDMQDMLESCSSLKTIPLLDTSKVYNFGSMFSSCRNLESLPLLDFSSATYISGVFSGCNLLTTVEGFLNLGKSYSISESANYYSYKLELQTSPTLTETSIINVLNNLYDIKTKGCQSQKVVLGSTNLAKLTSEEGQTSLSNAQAKGWTIS